MLYQTPSLPRRFYYRIREDKRKGNKKKGEQQTASLDLRSSGANRGDVYSGFSLLKPNTVQVSLVKLADVGHLTKESVVMRIETNRQVKQKREKKKGERHK